MKVELPGLPKETPPTAPSGWGSVVAFGVQHTALGPQFQGLYPSWGGCEGGTGRSEAAGSDRAFVTALRRRAVPGGVHGGRAEG